LSKICDAEKRYGPRRANMRNQNGQWHHHGAGAEREFARDAERELAADQVTGKRAANQTAHARSGARHPGEHANGSNIETARVVKIFWKPEEIEKPCRIAEKFGSHKSPSLAETEKANPR